MLDRRHRGESGGDTKSCSECSQRNAHAHDTASNKSSRENVAGLLGEGTQRKWRNLSIQPILLIGKGEPSLRHSRITAKRRLAFGVLRQLQAVLRVFSE